MKFQNHGWQTNPWHPKKTHTIKYKQTWCTHIRINTIDNESTTHPALSYLPRKKVHQSASQNQRNDQTRNCYAPLEQQQTKLSNYQNQVSTDKLQNIGFLSNTGLDTLKNHKASKPVFNVGSTSARQRNAI